MATSKPKANTKSSEGSAAHLVCPGCYTQYEVPEHIVAEERPICRDCGLPLLRSEENRKGLKCLRCIHRAVVPHGIWCRQLNCAATAEIVELCRHYAPRRRNKRKC